MHFLLRRRDATRRNTDADADADTDTDKRKRNNRLFRSLRQLSTSSRTTNAMPSAGADRPPERPSAPFVDGVHVIIELAVDVACEGKVGSAQR